MSIERRAVSALKWATTAKVVVQLVSWSCTLIVIRLLTPEDYGLMAKVGVVSGITSAIAEPGLGGAIIRTPNRPRRPTQDPGAFDSPRHRDDSCGRRRFAALRAMVS